MRVLRALAVAVLGCACGPATVIHPVSVACPLEVSGPADLAMQCYPGDFDIQRVVSNERGILVQIKTRDRVDFGGTQVVERSQTALVFFDGLGIARWHADVRCPPYGCAIALGHDGSAVAADGSRLTWFFAGRPPFFRPLSVVGEPVSVALAADGSALLASTDRDRSDFERPLVNLTLHRARPDGSSQLLAQTTLWQLYGYYSKPSVLAVDEQGVMWTGTQTSPPAPALAVIGPRGIAQLPFEPRRRGIRSLPGGGALLQMDDVGRCGSTTEQVRQGSTFLLAVLHEAAVTWKRCLTFSDGGFYGDNDFTGNELVLAGSTAKRDTTIDGFRLGSTSEHGAFVARFGAVGGPTSVTHIASSSVVVGMHRVQAMPDGHVLALGMFHDPKPGEGPTAGDPFAPRRNNGAFLVRVR